MRFTIYPDGIKCRISELSNVERELRSIAVGIEEVINMSPAQMNSYVQVKRALRNYRQNVQAISGNTSQLRAGLEKALQEYRIREQTVSERASRHSSCGGGIKSRNPLVTWQAISGAIGGAIGGAVGEAIGGAISGGFALWDFIQDIYNAGYDDSPENGLSWSVLGGSQKWSTDIYGMPVQAEGEYHLGHLEATGSIDTVWKMGDVEESEKWEIKAGVEGEVNLSSADGKISGTIGMAKGTAEASIGNVGVAGSVGLSIFSDGKFAPSVYGKASAEASVLEGKASGQVGSDEYNVHAKAEGAVLKAKAEAEVQVGRIVDGKGNVEYGVSAEAGAEAYIAEGSVGTGFTLFGIKIDASVKGKAGGVGAKAGAKVTSSAVEGEIDLGLGLGLGAGVKVKIDWTGFKWPW